MTTSTLPLRDAALALPDAERADLAYVLLRSLRPPTVPSAESVDFDEILDQRVRAFEAGETSAAEWETVSARLQQSLDDEFRP